MLSYTLMPELPTGLKFDPQIRVLSGVPTTVVPARTYTYTVTDVNGESDSLSFSITVASATAVTVRFSTALLRLNEGDTGTYTINLTARPSGNVTVQLASDDPAVKVSPESMIFTTDNWDRARKVTVRAEKDPDDADETATLTHRVSGYGSVTDGGTVTVNVNDTDTAGVWLIPERLNLNEGDTGTYAVRLGTRPSGNVTVRLASDDPAVKVVRPPRLTFTTGDWDEVQTVTVEAVEDDNDVNETATISHNVVGYGDLIDGGTVTVRVNDNDADTAGLAFSTRQLELNEADSGTYTINLTTRPSGNVTVRLASDDPAAVKVSPESLIFTTDNWESPQTVTVQAVPDDDAEDETATLSHRVSGYGGVTNGGKVAVVVNDTDQIIRLTLSTRVIRLNEGGTATYAARLSQQPTGTVTVQPDLENGNPNSMVTFSPATLIFTTANWNREQIVTVSAVPDAFGPDALRVFTFITHRVMVNGIPRDSTSRRLTLIVTYEDPPAPAKNTFGRIIDNVLSRILGGQKTVIPRPNPGSAIGVRGFRDIGNGTLILGGQTITIGADRPTLAMADADWRFIPQSEREDEGWSRSLDADELLQSSAFTLSLGAADASDAQPGSQVSVWGRGDLQYFRSDPDRGASYDGDLRAGYLGVEMYLDQEWLAGVAVSRTKAEADYDLGTGGTGNGGQLGIALNSVLPYVRFAPDADSELWAILGAGQGSVENSRPGTASGQEHSDLAMWTISSGGRHAVDLFGPVEWALLGDVGFGRISIADGTQAIAGLTVETWQARMGVKGSYTMELEQGGTFTPFMEIAGRYDGGGDGEAGLEVSPGLNISDADGFNLQLNGRILVLHSAENYEEYGVSATASLSPQADGSGLSLSLSPRWGDAASGTDMLWRETDLGRMASRPDNRDALSLDARVGYGVSALNGVVTPFGELDLGERGARRARLGIRFDRLGWSLNALGLELSGERRENGESAPEHRMDFTGRLRF